MIYEKYSVSKFVEDVIKIYGREEDPLRVLMQFHCKTNWLNCLKFLGLHQDKTAKNFKNYITYSSVSLLQTLGTTRKNNNG